MFGTRYRRSARRFARKPYKRYAFKLRPAIAPRVRQGALVPRAPTRMLPEVKHQFIDVSGANSNSVFASDFQYIYPSVHGGGSISGQMIGTQVRAKYVSGRYFVQNSGSTVSASSQLIRIAVIIDYSPNADAIEWYDTTENYQSLFLRTGAMESDYSPHTPRRFKVLYDRVHVLSPVGQGQNGDRGQFYVPLNEVQSFTKSVGTQDYFPQNFAVAWNSVASSPGIALELHLDYGYTDV